MDGYVKKEVYDELKSSYDQLAEKMVLQQDQLAELKRLIFGRKSERFEIELLPEQLRLALEGDPAPDPAPIQTETITYTRQKQKKAVARSPLPEHLERKEVFLEPDVDTSDMVCIGQEVSERLAKQPAKLYVLQIIRRKYAKADGSGVIIARMPRCVIDKGIADESLLADVLVSKYVDHQPLYRQTRMLEREGVKIPSSTMSDWVRACGQILEPLYEALKKEVLSSDYLQVDESPIKVQDRKKQGKTHRGYQWVYHDVGMKLVLFDYRKGRSRDGPAQMLKDFRGYLQTDGYNVYEDFGQVEGITLLGCMAHARRYFDKALKNDPVRAAHVLKQMQLLYALERQLRDQKASWEERLTARQGMAEPVLNELKGWLEEERKTVMPKSTIGTAINYSLERWDKLTRYTTHGGLEIDNNLIENQIRPLALGRKNYLFAGSHDSARHMAIFYSLMCSCKLHGLNPFEYLYAILSDLPEYPVNKVSDLLPCRVKLTGVGV